MQKWYEDFVDLMKSIFDFSLFLDPKFVFINLAILLLFVWYIVPYFYITEHIMRYNFSESDGAFIISLIGVFNTIGMVLFGWLGDRPWINVTKTYSANMLGECLTFRLMRSSQKIRILTNSCHLSLVCGLSVGLVPLVGGSYTMMCLLAALFGITFASSFAFTPTILVQIVDLEDFTCAYGLILLTQGVGSLIGPPIAGIMYDLYQT